MPDEEDRRSIFKIHLRNKPLAPNIGIEDLASKSENLSGAEIAGACHKAALKALRRAVEQGGGEKIEDTVQLSITLEDLLGTLVEVH
jgi:transitional endoplasmic reticulum ATPase